jgi:spore coat protein U-like protein
MRMHRNALVLARPLAALGLLGLAATASAQTASTNLSVSSTLSASCSVAASALSFGTQVPSPMTAAVDATATITATCTNGRAYTIGLNNGSGAGATETVRKMTGSSGTVDYAIYADSARTTVWGTGAAAVAQTGNGLAQALTAYGRMPLQTGAAAGTYTDSVTVTITF